MIKFIILITIDNFLKIDPTEYNQCPPSSDGIYLSFFFYKSREI